ncbi:MAG TPA: hypothetical protein VKQ72_20690 [Aggregatilineales bacterium]|nr:hypothetical protein [Aggregatilineales bacterium]
MLLPRLELLIGGFVFVLLIGLGPALNLVSRRQPTRILLACCMAPLVGLVELGIVLYPLVYADHPLNSIAVPAADVLLLLSAILVGVTVRTDRGVLLALIERKRAMFVTVLLTAICAAFVLFALTLPLIVSNLEYGLWQSSPWDATNYMLTAWHAQHLLWSYGANPAHYQDLLNINPALATIMAWFPHDRPVSAIALGWFSTVLGVPVYYAYYPYKLLSLFCSFWVTLAVCSLIGIRGWQRYMSAIVIAIGFWGVFIVDIDASSQLNAIPLSLLFLFAWLQLELSPAQTQKIVGSFGREHVLFALSFAGLIGYYPEFIVLLSAALIGYYAFQILHRPAFWRVTLNRVLTLGAGS